MQLKSTYQVNCNGAAQMWCYFCGTDEFDLDLNINPCNYPWNKRNEIDARYKMSKDAELN